MNYNTLICEFQKWIPDQVRNDTAGAGVAVNSSLLIPNS